MGDQIARRRMNIIASHFTATNEEALSPNHIFPLNCSSSLNSIIRRCDNRMLFARQGSISQGCFMREVLIKQEFGHGSSLQEGTPLKSSGLENEKYSYELPGAPLFARPAQTDVNISHVGDHQPVKQECELSSIEPPVFARASKGMVGQKQPSVKMIRHAACCDGFEWSPRMDIAESGRNYVVTVEIPGVSMDGIRVEVDSRNLTVTGKRSIQWWRVANVSDNSNPTYHRREILQGPYQVVWPLPDDVNKDSVSAEFVFIGPNFSANSVEFAAPHISQDGGWESRQITEQDLKFLFKYSLIPGHHFETVGDRGVPTVNAFCMD